MKTIWSRRKKKENGAVCYYSSDDRFGWKLRIRQTGPQDLVSYWDLPKESRGDFDYLDDDQKWDYRFAREPNGINWVDTGDMVAICHPFVGGWHENHPFAGWHEYLSDSYFSGVLVRHIGDDRVVIGIYTS